ncbi:uncharacterized protein LOC129942230 isoform X2 [Eupeodes corollae]|uniref:uncharacterized protein LOC129942230 isoform X2 n=1 Tax=Eupeodes corollae TaxID=290404 RepID=UPI002491BA77|nr:uncharacterized protein LOC129942230 isoform X2 [Eupeodes corollae]
MERSKELLSAFFDVLRSGPCLWKSANPLTQSQNATQSQPNSQLPQQQQPQTPLNVNLEIGGLVTNMQKSFLQDTSPPSSICSSMDVSLYGMNSSLITSSDFLSNNLLQSIQGDVPMSGLFFDGEKTAEQIGGYTLNDMIRDRKALESLSLSAEGTLIKDSNIAQIDDISLINSKTTSACSTMNNSVDSTGGAGSDTFSSRTCNIAEREREQQREREKEQQESLPEKSFDQKLIFNETFPSGKEQIVPNGDDDYIGDTTFNLVDSSIVTTTTVQPVVGSAEMKAFIDLQNETFQKPIMEETVCLKRFSIADGVNTTFDCSEQNLLCETPENNLKNGKHYEQSTPHQNSSFTSMRQKPSFTPSIEVNISPIVGYSTTPNRTLNETYEKPVSIATNILKERIQNETFSEPQALLPPRLPCNDDVNNAIETMELLENINPNETFNKCIPFSKSIPGGTPAVDTADEEAFNNLLDNLGKLELNEEQIKMQKSLETIKKRFSTALDKSEAKETSQICSPETPLSFSMNSSGIGDRLLSRRSRLYDGVNIAQPQKNSPSGSVNSNSFVKETEGGIESEETHKKTDEQHCTEQLSNNPNAPPQDDKVPRNSSKLEKRDRDRFRTIRIFKRTENGTSELNVPCIDGDNEHLPSTEEEDETPQTAVSATTTAADRAPMERISRRDITPPVAYNNNNNNKTETESNNYATFKKPKAKMSRYGGGGFGMNGDQLNRPVIAPPPPAATAIEKPTEQQRSLSRPRYISGLQKFSASSKAISAGDLEKATEQQNSKCNGDVFNKTQPASGGAELKSPMGIKSKSFHNLSSNFGYAKNPAPAVMAAPAAAGVRKSTTAGSVLTDKQGKFNNTTKTTIRMNAVPGSNLKQPVSKNEKSDDSVFKTPSLVSGLRAPSAKRTGLLRPSSGYYSFGVVKGEAATTNAADTDAGRHSPTDSMSSASSRGSSNGKLFPNGSSTQTHEPSSMPPSTPLSSLQQPAATTKSTGIPKPSGLRPPSSIKRSGLPRPSSIVRR